MAEKIDMKAMGQAKPFFKLFMKGTPALRKNLIDKLVLVDEGLKEQGK